MVTKNKDLLDAYSLGYISIDWLAVLTRQIDQKVKSVEHELNQQGYESAHFKDLKKLIAITNFLADEQLEHFDSLKTINDR